VLWDVAKYWYMCLLQLIIYRLFFLSISLTTVKKDLKNTVVDIAQVDKALFQRWYGASNTIDYFMTLVSSSTTGLHWNLNGPVR